MSNIQETYISSFFKLESAGGIILIFAAVLALIFANTPLQSYNALFLDTPVEIRIGTFETSKPLLLWINGCILFPCWS